VATPTTPPATTGHNNPNLHGIQQIVVFSLEATGGPTSVKALTAAIRRFIDGWNDRCHPFTWIKTADDILDHCRPGQRTSFTRH
jgi:hypothetical protein